MSYISRTDNRYEAQLYHVDYSLGTAETKVDYDLLDNCCRLSSKTQE